MMNPFDMHCEKVLVMFVRFSRENYELRSTASDFLIVFYIIKENFYNGIFKFEIF